MGSTTVEFRGRGFEAADAALAVWLELLARQIDRFGCREPWLLEARDEWHLQATAGFGFGVMPGLDRIVTDDKRRDAVLRLSEAGLDVIHGWGQWARAEDLNALETGEPGSYFTEDLPAEAFRRVAEYFIKLLKGELRDDEIDSRLTG